MNFKPMSSMIIEDENCKFLKIEFIRMLYDIFNRDDFDIKEVDYDESSNVIFITMSIMMPTYDEYLDKEVLKSIDYEVDFYSDAIMSFDLDDIFNISKEEPNGLFLYKQFTIANGLSVLWKNNPYIK